MIVIPKYDPSSDVLFISDDLPPYPLGNLFHHLWIRGASGSLKTALISDIVCQLIELAGYFRHLSIIIADCKGENTLLNEARETAAQWSVDFHLLNSSPGYATLVFNPLVQSYVRNKPPVYRAEAFADAIGISYGEGFGESHFGAINERALREPFSMPHPPRSFLELDQYFKSRPSRAGGRFGPVHAMNTTDKLGQIPFLNQLGGGQIDIAEMFLPGVPQVLYAYLPADELAATNYAILRLLFYVAYTVARDDYYPGGKKNGLIFICDEVQDVVSPTILRLLDKARSRRVGVIFAHQNRAQLQRVSEDAGNLFYNGFGTHIHFTPTDQPDAEEFISAETYFHKHDINSRGKSYSESFGYTGENRSYNESFGMTRGNSEQYVERPVFDMNRLRKITAEPNRFLFRVTQQTTRFDEVGRYIVCDRFHHIDSDVYERRANTPPPKEPFADGMIVNPLYEQPPDDADPTIHIHVPPHHRPRPTRMKLDSQLARSLFGEDGRAAAFLRQVPRPNANHSQPNAPDE